MEEKHNSPATAAESATPSSSEVHSSRRRGGALKRKASNLNSNTSTPPPSSSSKRQTREKPSPVLFPPIHNGPLTRARLQPNYADSTSFWDAVDVNGEAGGTVVATPVAAKEAAKEAAKKVEEELNARRKAWEALESKIEAEFDCIKSRDDNVHVVPISCGWFSWTKVHPLEEIALPSFFNGKSENRTPEIYMEIRNSIMKRFRENPKTQIEEKDLSEISVGELDAKKEVMEFLDYWGLINYHPLPEADTGNSVGNTEEVAKVNSLIKKLYEFDVEQLGLPAVLRSSFAAPTIPDRVTESIITDDAAQPEGPSVEYHCNSCAADCSRKRYHCQKQADFDLCTQCFNDGKFDSDMAPSDFILMEPGDAAGASGGKWTDQETLLLLEALELFSENWNEIAEHVATKTKAQCILHFLQMPIEDTFQDCDDEDDKDEKKDTKGPEENGEKKEVDQSQQENDVKTEVDEKNSDSQDTKETKDSKANSDQTGSCPMEISESVDKSNEKLKDDNEENGVNIAMKALREAFDAVGYPSFIDEKLSFADAGNPVMAMAAFLTRLVKPDIATVSARTSLKSVAKGSTGLQLSARHSFILEDPTDETKKADDADRDVQELVGQEGLKEKTDSCNKQEEETEDTKVTENENKTEKQLGSDEKKEDTVTVEVADEIKEDTVTPEVTDEKKEDTVTAEVSDGKKEDTVMTEVGDDKKEDTVTAEVSDDKKEDAATAEVTVENKEDTAEVTDGKKEDTVTAEVNDDKKEDAVTAEVTVEKKEDTAEVTDGKKEDTAEVTDGKKEETAEVSVSKKGRNSGTRRKGASKKDKDLVNEKPASTEEAKKETEDSADGAGPELAVTEAPKDEEMVEKTEPSLSTLAENTPNSGGIEAKDTKNENKKPLDVEDDPVMHNLTRAAVTAISAAAVKAKLLADQEEDQIRQLATSLLEKQLQKLEMKLTFFNEMDGVVSRAREQLERAKQRLYHERAQIITARLGMSGAASLRSMANSSQRPPNPMNMTPQRPPLSRPMMGPTPVAGNPAQISSHQGTK